MSTKELKFKWQEYDCDVVIDRIDSRIRFVIDQHGNTSAFELERSQADLLRLFLEEHLKVTPKGYWQCNRCGRMHPEFYVCTMLGKQ